MIKSKTAGELTKELEGYSAEDCRAALWSILVSLYGTVEDGSPLVSTDDNIVLDPDKQWEVSTLDEIYDDLRNYGMTIEDERERCDSCGDPLEVGQIGKCEGCQ